MSGPYSGVCVGGPYSGRQITHTSNVLRVDTRPPLPPPLSAKPGRRAPDMAISHHFYQHHVIGGIGVWALDTENEMKIMTRLLAIYMAAVKEDREDD